MLEIRNDEYPQRGTVISAYIITKNEEKNISRALTSVQWMDECIVLDSGSVDETVEIAKKLGVKVSIEAFKDFTTQKNRAMELCSGQWLFNLDADEEVTPELRKSIEDVVFGKQSSDVLSAFRVSRKILYMGRWMKHCGWYPEYRVRLSKKGCAEWRGEVLHERLVGNGKSGLLSGDLLHRPYENLGDHLRTITRYTELWAQRESSRGRKSNIFDIVMRPCAKFFKMYILKAGFLDFSPGLIASLMGAFYTFMKYARLFELSRSFE